MIFTDNYLQEEITRTEELITKLGQGKNETFLLDLLLSNGNVEKAQAEMFIWRQEDNRELEAGMIDGVMEGADYGKAGDAPKRKKKHNNCQIFKSVASMSATAMALNPLGIKDHMAKDVEELVKKMGGRVSIRTRRTISNKQTRIEMASDGILKHFYFKDKSLYKPSDQYGQMMRELVTYTRTGKVKHDDSPDGLSLLENEIRNLTWGKAEVFRRPF